MKKFSKIKLMIVRLGYRVAYLGWKCLMHLCIKKTVGAQVVVWSKNKVLLVKASYRNDYSFPGGYLKRDETSVRGALRELSEETGLQLNIHQLKYFKLFKETCKNTDVHNFIYEAFIDFDLQQYVAIDGQEIIEAGFYKRDELTSLPLDESVIRYLSYKTCNI